jgi:hypothetical protein
MNFENKKIEAELEKIRLEIKSLQNEPRWGAILVRLNPMITTGIIVAGIILGLLQLGRQQERFVSQLSAQQSQIANQLSVQQSQNANANANQSSVQINLELDAKKQELRKRYWEEQISTYRDGCEMASKIAIANKIGDVSSERKRFWQLYWGLMALVEHPEVEHAMTDFGGLLLQWEEHPSEKPESITNSSSKLAHCFRKSLQKTWSPVDLGDLKNGTCPY